jgi:hypothetical protein
MPDELRFKLRYRLIRDHLLNLNIPGLYNDISYQHRFLEELHKVYEKSITSKDIDCMVSTYSMIFKYFL